MKNIKVYLVGKLNRRYCPSTKLDEILNFLRCSNILCICYNKKTLNILITLNMLLTYGYSRVRLRESLIVDVKFKY